MGMVELLRRNPAEAEKHYRKAVELNAAHPDAVSLLRLALSLDQQKKYAEALPFANQAVEVSAPVGGVAAELAKQEQERLNQLTGKTSPAPVAAPPPKS
jgi:tetratricopeptide (TPR) repeat protein